MLFGLALVAVVLTAQAQSPTYKVDYTWPQQLPANATRFTAAAVVGDKVYIAQRGTDYPDPILVFRSDGSFVQSWGGRDVYGTAAGGSGVHGMNYNPLTDQLWLTNVLDHTVSTYSLAGAKLTTYGTAMKPGTSTNPLQFSSVADVDFAGNTSFISDGDGGLNNRVMSLTEGQLDWIQGSAGSKPLEFSSPHTITYNPVTDTVIVGDRGNNRTQHLTRSGAYIDGWDLSPKTAWGIRYDHRHSQVVMCDGDNQEVRVYDGTSIDSTPRLLATVAIDKMQCNTPHEMALDYGTGDIYLTCVNSPNSNVVKIVRTSQ